MKFKVTAQMEMIIEEDGMPSNDDMMDVEDGFKKLLKEASGDNLISVEINDLKIQLC